MDRPKSVSKMTPDELMQELKSHRAKQSLKTKLLRDSLSKAVELTESMFGAAQAFTANKIQNACDLIQDEKDRETFKNWFNEMYQKYKKSNWKWLVRIVVSALLFYLIGEAIIYFGRNWLLSLDISKWIMKTFSLLEGSLLWLVRGATSLFGGIFGTVYNFFKGK